MTGTAAARVVPAAPRSGEFPGVLAGVVLEGPAAGLAGMLDGAFLAGAGWDPVTRVLSLPAGHRLLGTGRCAGWMAAPRPRMAPRRAGCAGGALPG